MGHVLFAVASCEWGDVVGGVVGEGVAALGGFDFFKLFAVEADAGEAAVGGEDDHSALVVVGFAFVHAQNGELDSVDGAEFFGGEVEGEGGQGVEFDEALAALVRSADGAVAVPFGGKVGPGAEAGVGFGEAVRGEGGVPAFLPEVGVVGGETV